MAVSNVSALERIARVLAGRRASINADGDHGSAGAEVDGNWEQHRKDAIAILKTLREPDETMAAAGDAKVWRTMVLAALGSHAEGEAP